MGKTAIILMILTLISKITGLIREKFFAYFLGTSDILDIYNTSASIPEILFGFITASLITLIIPVYQEINLKKGKKEADSFISNTVNITIVIALIFIGIIYLSAPVLVKIFAPAYEGQKLENTIIFTRILSSNLFLSVLAPIFIAYLRINNKFITAELPGIIMNVLYVISLFIYFFTKNIFILPILFVISEIIKYAFFPNAIRKSGYKHKWIFNIKDNKLKEIAIMAIPIMLSVAAMDISTISDQSLATIVMPTGGISIMRFSSLILSLINGVIVVSITTSIYPTISKYANENKIKKLKETLLDGNIFSFLFIVPSIIGVTILSEPLIRLLFQGGNFNKEATSLTASVLVFYIPALLGQTIIQMISRGYYSLKNTVTPIAITIVQVTLNILLNNILSPILGLQGLALATSISSLSAGFASIFLFNRKYGNMGNKILLMSLFKIFIASIIMGVFTYISYHSLVGIHYLLAFLVSILTSIIVFSISIIFMRIPQMIKLLNLIYRKFKKKK